MESYKPRRVTTINLDISDILDQLLDKSNSLGWIVSKLMKEIEFIYIWKYSKVIKSNG